MDYVRNKRHFSRGLIKLGAVLVWIGVFLALIGALTDLFYGLGTNALVVGVVLALGGIVWILVMDKRRPKGAEIDGQVQEEVKQIYQKALNKHGIAEETVQRSAPIVFGGYVLDEATTAKLFAKRFNAKTVGGQVMHTVESAVALGSVMSASVFGDIPAVKHITENDCTVRSTLAEYTIILFSEEKAYVYTRRFSLVDPEIELKEFTREYAYRDIVSVSSETLKYGSHAFIVKASGGNTLTIPCSNARAADIKENVTAFMQLVRETKGA